MTTFWLEIQRRDGIDRRAIAAPDEVGKPGIAEGACPGCGCAPFGVVGSDMTSVDAETIRANGRCVSCNDPVGYVFARTDTIFGAEEDANMIGADRSSRARVYR